MGSARSSTTSFYSEVRSDDNNHDYQEEMEVFDRMEGYCIDCCPPHLDIGWMPVGARKEVKGEIVSILFVESHDAFESSESYAKRIFSTFMYSVAGRQQQFLEGYTDLLMSR